MKDIELKIERNLVSVKYYNEEFKMSFGKDPNVKPDAVNVLTTLDFLLYLIKKKHKGQHHDLTVFSNGRVQYQSMSFISGKHLLLYLADYNQFFPLI